MFEAILVFMFISIILVAWICRKTDKKLDSVSAKDCKEVQEEKRRQSTPEQITKERKNNNHYSFERHNVIEGLLRAEGHSYETFNTGILRIGEHVEIEIVAAVARCRILDIRVNHLSLMHSAPPHLSEADKAVYLIELITESCNKDLLNTTDAKNTIDKIISILTFDEVMQKGWISAPNGEMDYVWTK